MFHPQLASTRSQQEMQKHCFKFYWNLAQTEPESGVKVYPMTEYFDDRLDDSTLWYKSLMPNYQVNSASYLPNGVTFGVKYTSMAINPLILLPWLKRTLVARGVQFIRAEVESIAEVESMARASIIVHASGLSAKKLAGDKNVKPVRGQTMFVHSDFSELVMREGSDYTYVIPRPGSGGVIIGGIKSDRLDTEVDVDLKSGILARVNLITNGAFHSVDLASVEDIVGFRPGRDGGPIVEREGNIIHAYGMGGAGYIYSFGAAHRVRELIDGHKAML